MNEVLNLYESLLSEIQYLHDKYSSWTPCCCRIVATVNTMVFVEYCKVMAMELLFIRRLIGLGSRSVYVCIVAHGDVGNREC